MEKWALVTGATVGIGEKFTEKLAAEGFNIILNARNTEMLHAAARRLEDQYKIKTVVLPADLSTQCEVVEKYIKEHQVDFLVNNAGFGLNQAFSRTDVEDEQRLLDVLVAAPMRLAHAVLPQMRERKSGTIINVASVAAFIAGGHYSAAKSYVVVLSESLAAEAGRYGVNVSVLCPGFTHTEFHQRAGMKMGGLPKFMWLSSDFVVSQGLRDARKGLVISVPGWQYKVLLVIIRLFPRNLVRRFSISLRSSQR
jgi:short-subunit dehydrogenase